MIQTLPQLLTADTDILFPAGGSFHKASCVPLNSCVFSLLRNTAVPVFHPDHRKVYRQLPEAYMRSKYFVPDPHGACDAGTCIDACRGTSGSIKSGFFAVISGVSPGSTARREIPVDYCLLSVGGELRPGH